MKPYVKATPFGAIATCFHASSAVYNPVSFFVKKFHFYYTRRDRYVDTYTASVQIRDGEPPKVDAVFSKC